MSRVTPPITPVDELRQRARELDAAIARVEELTADQGAQVRALQQQIIDLKGQLAEQEVGLGLADELERNRAEHQRLRERIHSPQFWTDAFARPFAMGVHELNALQGELAVDQIGELHGVFHRWQREIADGLTALSGGPHDEAMAERLRRLLLVQWVYLQWVSVTQATGEETASAAGGEAK